MKNRLFLVGILAFVLVLGMTVGGCDNGTTDGDSNGNNNDDDNGEELPTSSGVNAVGGKTYYTSNSITIFSTTANDATTGTYTVKGTVWDFKKDDYVLANGKFTYADEESGTYSWNEGAKTVTLKPEKVACPPTGSDSFSPGPLVNKANYRKKVQASFDYYKKEMGEADFNAMLQYAYGSSNIKDAINYRVNDAFSNATRSYSFTTDESILFLEWPLPANKGANEFSGQTYHGLIDDIVKDENHTYVFTAASYTETRWDSNENEILEIITGSYAYDSSEKQVWLQPETINGKDRAAFFTEQTADNEHHFVDDNTFCAYLTSIVFNGMFHEYSSTNKTIDSSGWREGRLY